MGKTHHARPSRRDILRDLAQARRERDEAEAECRRAEADAFVLAQMLCEIEDLVMAPREAAVGVLGHVRRLLVGWKDAQEYTPKPCPKCERLETDCRVWENAAGRAQECADAAQAECERLRGVVEEAIDMIEDAHAGNDTSGPYVAFPSDREETCERFRAALTPDRPTAHQCGKCHGPDCEGCRVLVAGKARPQSERGHDYRPDRPAEPKEHHGPGCDAGGCGPLCRVPDRPDEVPK